MDIFKRIGKAIINEIVKPGSFVKGEQFEEYVRTYMFPKKDYDLVHRTHDYKSNSKDYVEDSLKPDFKFRDKKTGKEFYVEVKWRAGRYNREDKIEWCNDKQLKRYKDIDKSDCKVFVVLGLGDNPKTPEEIILFPVCSCNYSDLYDSFMDKYSFYLDKSVFAEYLWKLH